jgi:hypothetical protein
MCFFPEPSHNIDRSVAVLVLEESGTLNCLYLSYWPKLPGSAEDALIHCCTCNLGHAQEAAPHLCGLCCVGLNCAAPQPMTASITKCPTNDSSAATQNLRQQE